MTDSPQQESSPQETPPGRNRRSPTRSVLRWVLRFSAWSLLAALIGVGLTIAVGAFVYLNRVAFINQILAAYVAPFEVKVDRIDFLPLGTVTIEDLRLRPKGSSVDEPMVLVPEAKLTYSFDELRRTRRFRTVAFENPAIRLSRETLESLGDATGSGDGTGQGGPVSLETFSFFSESFLIHDGSFHVDLPGMTGARSKWSLETGPLEFDADGWLAEPISVRLSDLEIGPPDEVGGIARLVADLRFTRDFSDVRLGEIVIPSSRVTLTPELLAAFADPGESSGKSPDPRGPATPVSTDSKSGTSLTIDRLVVEPSTFRVRGFDGKGGAPKLPEISFETGFEIGKISNAGGRWNSGTPIAIDFDQLAIESTGAHLASVEVVALRAESLAALVHDRSIRAIEIVGIDLSVSDRSLERVSRPGPEHADEPEPPEPLIPPQPWTIDSLRIEGGHLLVHNLTHASEHLPRVESVFSASLSHLEMGGVAGFSSEAVQEIRLEQSRLWPPGVTPANTAPLLRWERADLGLRWDAFQHDGRIESITVRGPTINFTDESLGSWLDFDLPRPGDPRPINRPVYAVDELLVTGGQLVADSSFAERTVPKIVSEFEIETDNAPDRPAFFYRTTLSDFQLRNHAVTVEPIDPTEAASPGDDALRSPVREESVLRIDEITMEATAAQLQRTRRIDNLTLSGAVLDVGSGLESLIESVPQNDTRDAATEDAEPADAAPAEPAGEEAAHPSSPEGPSAEDPPARAELPTWIVEKLAVERSEVRFESLIPQVEGLEFEVNTVLEDVPLSPDGLLAQEKVQKMELSGLEIRDPYNSFITVAELPTIFVEFSLAGLARREVDRIDLINPSLYVGQGLFWWIEYQRKFREQNEGSRIRITEKGPAPAAPEENTDWSIRRIEATAGKIVVAPTGVPIGVVPFPFHASTSLDGGEIELVLEIPDEEHVYHFPDYQITLHGLEGDVLFNVPVKDEDNNLVQKFYLDRIIWKKYEADDLYLSVTFDEDGIYGDLGGHAYSGYVNAGFNFYLDKPGRWDAWIAGTDLDTGPITDRLAPENFRMEGPISLKLISEGFRKQLGETSAEIQTTGPGWFDVTKLDAILENLPEDWTGWQQSLTELSLIALKRFDYDKGSGSLYLRGRDGLFALRFLGHYGIRELNLHLHDERNTTAGEPSGGENEGAGEARAVADTE